jgi:hypothetical protein
MTSTPDRPRQVPTADLIASTAVWHWIAGTPAGPVAFLLLAPTPSSHLGTQKEARSRMRGLAASPHAPGGCRTSDRACTSRT